MGRNKRRSVFDSAETGAKQESVESGATAVLPSPPAVRGPVAQRDAKADRSLIRAIYSTARANQTKFHAEHDEEMKKGSVHDRSVKLLKSAMHSVADAAKKTLGKRSAMTCLMDIIGERREAAKKAEEERLAQEMQDAGIGFAESVKLAASVNRIKDAFKSGQSLLTQKDELSGIVNDIFGGDVESSKRLHDAFAEAAKAMEVLGNRFSSMRAHQEEMLQLLNLLKSESEHAQAHAEHALEGFEPELKKLTEEALPKADVAGAPSPAPEDDQDRQEVENAINCVHNLRREIRRAVTLRLQAKHLKQNFLRRKSTGSSCSSDSALELSATFISSAPQEAAVSSLSKTLEDIFCDHLPEELEGSLHEAKKAAPGLEEINEEEEEEDSDASPPDSSPGSRRGSMERISRKSIRTVTNISLFLSSMANPQDGTRKSIPRGSACSVASDHTVSSPQRTYTKQSAVSFRADLLDSPVDERLSSKMRRSSRLSAASPMVTGGAAGFVTAPEVGFDTTTPELSSTQIFSRGVSASPALGAWDKPCLRGHELEEEMRRTKLSKLGSKNSHGIEVIMMERMGRKNIIRTKELPPMSPRTPRTTAEWLPESLKKPGASTASGWRPGLSSEASGWRPGFKPLPLVHCADVLLPHLPPSSPHNARPATVAPLRQRSAYQTPLSASMYPSIGDLHALE